MVINAISVLLVIKPFVSRLIVFIIVAISVLNKFAKCCKRKREGSSLRGISRTSGLAYNSVVSIVRSASQKAQLVHNQEVQSVETEEVERARCGHSSQKTEAMHQRGTQPGRLLDWFESCPLQWLDSRRLRGQTHRCVH